MRMISMKLERVVELYSAEKKETSDMHGYEEYSSCTVRSKPYIEMKRPHKGHRVDSRGQRA